MRRKDISEDEAYQSLRKMAMDKNKRIVDILPHQGYQHSQSPHLHGSFRCYFANWHYCPYGKGLLMRRKDISEDEAYQS
jgi:hypothetical protein